MIPLRASIRPLQPAGWQVTATSSSEVSTVRHGLRDCIADDAVTQASRRVWTDDFRQDSPLNRSLASRRRCLSNRSNRMGGSIADSTAVYVTMHLLSISETRRSFTAHTTEEVPVAGPHSKPFRKRLAVNCWISMISNELRQETREMSMKIIAQRSNNADTVGECSDVVGSAI